MKNFKRFIALFTVALIILATLIPSMTAAPAGVAAKAGETARLEYEYEAIGGIYGVFTFSNPEIIESVSFEADADFQGIFKNNTLAFFTYEPKTFKAVLLLEIAEDAEVGAECEVTFSYETTVEGRVPDSADYSEEVTVIRVEAIDYTALIEQISRVGRLNKDDYTPESWAAMTEVYSEAIALVDHARLQSQVDDMAARLKDAIDALVRKSIDYTALKAQIAVADGLNENDYTAESWAAMKDVYNRAKALVGNASTQNEVDGMTAELIAAINALVRKPSAPTIDYTALVAQIERADKLNEKDYTAASWSAMKAVYDRAKALVMSAGANSQAQVDSMTAELKTAIDSLVRKPVVVAIDYTALNAQIARADALKEEDYTAESWSAMKTVYDQAKALVGKATSQAQVNAMTENLKTAIDALVLKTIPAIDYTELKALIAIIEGLNKDDYTADSWEALMNMLNKAKALVDNAESQAEVDKMTADLKTAYEALVRKAVAGKIDYTKLKAQIERADKLNEKDYTAESWAAMKKIYDEAKALIDNAKTQEEVDAMTAKLQAAIDALVKAPSYAWIWWVVIILVLIVVAVVVYLYYKKKKSK